MDRNERKNKVKMTCLLTAVTKDCITALFLHLLPLLRIIIEPSWHSIHRINRKKTENAIRASIQAVNKIMTIRPNQPLIILNVLMKDGSQSDYDHRIVYEVSKPGKAKQIK